ncbi:helix-turn-helix transcriptional regulator [Parerythrobacter lacustris]|uniref:Helix-turn-helix transcriptional regulator n=1 Tax=Parerythrobacter lacustris TaxID=2969984 RepID=A0ABT1XSM1_9SPHN|nr:helix-turn-helix transcriptional regulator [Parerythrobacter lacustris]MCR2834217.1 helix-turn-helix transcriptional regulator [Parerythrobacter lacustris]
MPTPTIPDCALNALNDNELEILRLLANGHTAKSIAARLGRSEGAINERLREARRKTGAGSSRELARQVDARKIWDENIDLAVGGPSTETPDQPRTMGRQLSKGSIAMFTTISAAALALSVVAGTGTTDTQPPQPVQTVAVAPSPLVGRWALDVDRIPANERPQAVTIAFVLAPDRQWSTHVEMTGADGVMRYANSVAAANGVPVAVSGTMDFIDTVSLRQPEANTLVMTLGRGGAPISTRVYTVAADGRSMTETIIWPGTDLPKMETTYFNRVG